MRNIFGISFMTLFLAFSLQAVGSVKGSQDWLKANGLANQNLWLGEAFEIVNNQYTKNPMAANLQIVVVGTRIQISTTSNPRLVQMVEMSQATPRAIALMEGPVPQWGNDRTYLEVVKRDDGKFYVRFRDENRNGFEGIVTNIAP
jgi:hypothetical protein